MGAEIRITMERTAYSPILHEVVDFSCGVFDQEPNLIAETSGLPIFLANLGDAIKATYETIGRDELEPEDIIMCNDPYCGGGTHTPDITCLCPVFHSNMLFGFTAFRGHTLEMGGKDPGGWYSDTVEVYQEGLRVPPVKLYSRGKANDDIFRIIRQNSRMPDSVLGDIRAMVAATRTGGKRFVELIEKYGKETFKACVQEILNHGEKMVREAVRKIPEGEYRADVVLDGDGNDDEPLDERVDLKMMITVKGDEMMIDFSGTSPQCRGPMNMPLPSTISSARYGFKIVTTPFLPNNEGCFKPLRVKVPKGSILDPIPPAAIGLWPVPATSIPDLVLKALAPALPDKVRAGHFGDSYADYVYGVDPRTRKRYMIVEPVSGGYGGKPFEDGESGLFSMPHGDTYNIPIEVIEVMYPLLVERYQLIPDSGGAGKHRGGLGVRKDYRIIDHEAGMTVTFDRAIYSPPWGLFGGGSGRPNDFTCYRNDGRVEHWRKFTHLRLRPNDLVSLAGGGGGGYGSAVERDPELVRLDVMNGYVSVKSAREDYGVVVDEASLKVDYDSTHRLRQALTESGQVYVEASRAAVSKGRT